MIEKNTNQLLYLAWVSDKDSVKSKTTTMAEKRNRICIIHKLNQYQKP